MPKWALCNPRHFVQFHRKALESLPVSLTINEWVDLIFGFKQLGKQAADALNVFYIFTYEGSVDLHKIENISERNGVLDQIGEFGQTPRQLFNKAHPIRKRIEKSEAIFSDPGYLRAMICIPASKTQEVVGEEKIRHYVDFYIERELLGLSSDRITGLGSFLKMKPIKQTKEEFFNSLSNLRIIRAGTCLFGNTTKVLSFSNSYDQILMFEDHPEHRDFIDLFSLPGTSDASLLLSSRSKKWLILGTKAGFIFVYKAIKKKENLRSEAVSSCQFHHRNSGSSIDTFEERRKGQKHRVSFKLGGNRREMESTRLEASIEVKSQNAEIIMDEKIKSYYAVTRVSLASEKEKGIAFMDRGNVTQDMSNRTSTKNCSLFKKAQNNQANRVDMAQRKFTNSMGLSNMESKMLIEFTAVLRGHSSPITCMRIYEPLGLLLSGDQSGVTCLWDLEKGGLVIKLFSYHFIDFEVFRDICIEDETWFQKDHNTKKHHKILSRREAIVEMSVCEDNGDFCVISANYASLYNVNGVLISVVHRKREKLSKFTSCLLTQVLKTIKGLIIFGG